MADQLGNLLTKSGERFAATPRGIAHGHACGILAALALVIQCASLYGSIHHGRGFTALTTSYMAGTNVTDQGQNELPVTHLTRADITQNTIQSLLKAVPWIGEPLSQFIFGPLADLRMKRVERTLAEVGEAIRTMGVNVRVDTEEFANLLETVLPQVSRAVSEQRRTVLRDLLINASSIESGNSKWDEASLAAQMIAEIDSPGLAVIAAVSKCTSKASFMSSSPTPRIFDGGTEFTKPTETYYLINFEWRIVEEWTIRLREKRLLYINSSDARGGFGGVQLTELGRLVVEWSQRTAA